MNTHKYKKQLNKLKKYCIAGNFRLEKIFAFLPRRVVGEIFFGELFYPVKILSHWNFTRTGFTRGFQAVLY